MKEQNKESEKKPALVRIKMTQSVSGVDQSWDAGSVYEVSALQAKHWCEPKDVDHKRAEYVNANVPLTVPPPVQKVSVDDVKPKDLVVPGTKVKPAKPAKADKE